MMNILVQDSIATTYENKSVQADAKELNLYPNMMNIQIHERSNKIDLKITEIKLLSRGYMSICLW